MDRTMAEGIRRGRDGDGGPDAAGGGPIGMELTEFYEDRCFACGVDCTCDEFDREE